MSFPYDWVWLLKLLKYILVFILATNSPNLQEAGTMNLLLWLKTNFKKLNMESFPQGVVIEVFSKYPSEIQWKVSEK